MSRFRLITGRHCERVGHIATRYNPGDVVKSDKPLDVMFGAKFEKIGRQEPTEDVTDVEETTQETTEGSEVDEDTPETVEDVQDAPEDDPEDPEDVETTLKAVHRGRGRWDVVKVVDGVETEETVNDEFLLKDDAKALAAAGLSEED